MAEQILLHSGSFEDLREVGSLGRPLYTLYSSLKPAIEGDLGPEATLLLAEPVVAMERRQIDWYTWGNADPKPAFALSEAEREPLYQQLIERYDELAALAQRWVDSPDVSRAQLGKALAAALTPPSVNNLFWVDGHPVVIYWGFVPERQWGKPLDFRQLRVALNSGSVNPEKTTINGGKPPATEHQLPSAPIAIPTEATATTSNPVDAVPRISTPRQLFIVVGSKWFWSMLLLAGTLASITLFLHSLGWLPARAIATSNNPVEAKALHRARLAEAELRERFTALLLAFNERRLQCTDCPDTPTTAQSLMAPAGSAEQSLPPGTEAETASLKESVNSELAAAAGDPVEAIPQPSSAAREEFATRLENAGGTVGEIAVTLIWDNRNDLDLVVLCPTGERLYYNNPSGCGGALDVDKNAGNRLTDRPVENIRWPEGLAPTGTYQVAVKYYARNESALSPATPFHIRLLQNGQETLFKGTVVPDDLKWVTTFTVNR